MPTAPDVTAPSGAPPRRPRTSPDRCPTAIALHPAADGLIARVRVPGGRLTAEQAVLLARWARPTSDELGAASLERIEITGRGNFQIRGLRAEQAGPLAAALHGAGLLPSEPHDQARTIVASPLAGRLDGAAPVDDLVRAVDAALCAAPDLTALSGRFLTAVDDGTGQAGLGRADLGLQRLPAQSLSAATDERVTLFVGGVAAGTVPLAHAAEAFVAAARAFLTHAAGAAWQVRDLPEGGAGIIATLQDTGVVERLARVARSAAQASSASSLPPLGPGRQSDGRGFVRALAPLGRLTAQQLEATAKLAAAAGSELRLSGDRSLTVPDLAQRFVAPTVDGLAAAGLLVTGRDPGVGLTACAGLGCASSRGDVRAAAALRLAARRPGAPREHLVGCDRRCGAPAGADHQTFVLADGEQPPAFAARIEAAAAQETDR